MSRTTLKRTVLGYNAALDSSESAHTLTIAANTVKVKILYAKLRDPSGMWPLVAVWFRALRQEQVLAW